MYFYKKFLQKFAFYVNLWYNDMYKLMKGLITMQTEQKKKTPQHEFVEAFLASQKNRAEEAEKAGIKLSRIKREDLIGLVRFNDDFIVIHESDLAPFNF